MSIVWPLGQGSPSAAAIQRVSAPVSAPVSLEQAKLQARVEHNDDDALLYSLIAAAVDLLDGDGVLGRAMITQGWAQWVSQSPGIVRLLMGPFQSLTSIEYFDASGILQSAAVADFEIRKRGDHVTMEPKEGATWPPSASRPDAIKITYTAGFGPAASDVPQGLRHAILMLVAHWYDHRSAVNSGPASELPMAVNALIERHRVGWYG